MEVVNQLRWRTRTSAAERELRNPFGDTLVLGPKKKDLIGHGRKRRCSGEVVGSPAIMISASDSESRSPGVPLKKMFTSPTIGRAGISLAPSSPSEVLARIINVNSERVISRPLALVRQNEERTYCPHLAAIFLQAAENRGERNGDKNDLKPTLHLIFLFQR